MADLQRLAMEHARWSRVKRETQKEAGQIECKRQSTEGLSPLHDAEAYFNVTSRENCIEFVYRLVSGMKADTPYDTPYDTQVKFAEVWDEELARGNVCSGCARIRELKRQRVEASRKLGQIRSAITKAGEHLLKDGE